VASATSGSSHSGLPVHHVHLERQALAGALEEPPARIGPQPDERGRARLGGERAGPESELQRVVRIAGGQRQFGAGVAAVLHDQPVPPAAPRVRGLGHQVGVDLDERRERDGALHDDRAFGVFLRERPQRERELTGPRRGRARPASG
jgi:hypothetical protein